MTHELKQQIRARAEKANKALDDGYQINPDIQADSAQDVPALLSALQAAEARAEAAEGREKALREALAYILTRQAFQGQPVGWLDPPRLICPECDRVWEAGQPEQHQPECRLVAWRYLAGIDTETQAGEG